MNFAVKFLAPPLLVLVAASAIAESDSHAHHKKMMNESAHGRSSHEYSLDGIDVTLVGADESALVEVIRNDRPVMLHFIFTTCTTICPVQAATFAQVQRELGDEAVEVQMVSVSIDPEYDTPARLREYAQLFGAGPQWDFVTGTSDQMIRVQRAFDAYEGGKMNHKPLTLLRGAGADKWVRLDGLVRASDIIEEYRKLKSES